MKIRILSLGAALAALTITAPASAEPLELSPSSNWHLEFAEDNCRLTRTFGEGDERHILFFQQTFPSDTFGLTMAGTGFTRFSPARPVLLSMGDADVRRESHPFRGEVDDFGAALIYSSIPLIEHEPDENGWQGTTLPALDKDEAGEIDFISAKQGSREVILRTGKLGPAIAALNTCSQDLVRAWGLDLERHRTVTRYAKPKDLAKITREIVERYPRSALRAGEQAILRMRVMVEADGSVSDCVLQDVGRSEYLQSPACEEMRKAEFEPAIDADGQPMRSYYATSVIYKIG